MRFFKLWMASWALLALGLFRVRPTVWIADLLGSVLWGLCLPVLLALNDESQANLLAAHVGELEESCRKRGYLGESFMGRCAARVVRNAERLGVRKEGG